MFGEIEFGQNYSISLNLCKMMKSCEA
jgi:hypothetical protein